MEKIIQQLLYGFVLSSFGLLNIGHIEQPFQAVEVVFEVEGLVMDNGLIEGTHNEGDLLASDDSQSFDPLLLILLALYNFDFFFFELG